MKTAHLPNGTLLQGGKYKIVRFIGSGGFGCTYEGEHTMLGNKVAIKEFFVRDFCNREETTQVTVITSGKKALVNKLKRKFVEEARATSKMQHPNIVKVHDVFEENGVAYYVMDYIEGQSLEKIVKGKGRLPEQTALKYIRQVADALAYVHSHHRLHLDLKPGNIMVDKHGNTILVDFGASKQYDEAGGENTSTLIGKTPGYAPIEQMGNTVTTFTPATDIYALGATLYKLLTGITPIEATRLASGEELAPLPNNVSKNVVNAIHSAMQIDKTERPQNIDEFIAILKKSKHSPIKTVVITICLLLAVLAIYIVAKGKLPSITVSQPITNHEWVDLGLSVKWATCNIGAKSPTDFGDYYAWGEIKPKREYKKSNSVTYGEIFGCIAGDPQYDVASAKWGDSWRLPNMEEIDELINKCEWKYTEYDLHYCYKVTGPNGNSIFLPAAGWRANDSNKYYRDSYGYYWSATPCEGGAYSAYALYFADGGRTYWPTAIGNWHSRTDGLSIRPVTE